MKLFLSSAFYKVKDRLCEVVPVSEGKRMAFIPTASDIYAEHPWLDADREALVSLGFDVFDVDLKQIAPPQLYDVLSAVDVMFVGGGNTFYLLYHMRQSGFAEVLPTLLEQGKVYVGSSAGSVVVGPNIEPVHMMDDPAAAPDLQSYNALGLVSYVILPHYGSEKYEQRYQETIQEWSSRFELRTLKDDEVVVVQE